MDLFANRLRERAAELRISHAEAARRSSLSERRYSNYVSGIREPDLATLVRIATALGTTPNDLLGARGKQKPSSRSLLMDRLNSAAQLIGDHDLEVVITLTEALASRGGKGRGTSR
jgi:transcriptional regulator with XRE-family HTH domain